MFLGLGGVGTGEIALIVLGLLLLFGGRKIPELARGLGSGIREFQQGLKSKPEPPDQKRPEPDKKEGPQGREP